MQKTHRIGLIRCWRHVWLIVIWLLLLPACAVMKPPPGQPQSRSADGPAPQTTEPEQSSDTNYYWWYVPVKVTWPEHQSIAWYVDVLLAHQIFKPLLIEHAQHIQLWRFHRRAVRDSAGHQFSFLFYASQPTATVILDKLSQNTLIPELIAANVIDKVYLHERNAMGVSQVWLGLIDQYVASSAQNLENSIAGAEVLGNANSPGRVDVEALERFYQTIDQNLVCRRA